LKTGTHGTSTKPAHAAGYTVTASSLEEDGLVLALLEDGHAGLVLGVWVVGQLRGTRGHGRRQDYLLQVVEHLQHRGETAVR